MDDYDLALDYQRLAALKTMRPAHPDNVETLIKELFDAGTSKLTEVAVEKHLFKR